MALTDTAIRKLRPTDNPFKLGDSAGVDPAVDKKITQQKKKNGQTFRQLAMNWHADHRRWSEHYATTIRRRLEMCVFPDIGDRCIDQIVTEDLLFTLRKVENKGFLELTARLKKYVTESMRYAVKKQLIRSNPALIWTVNLHRRKHSITRPCRLRNCQNYYPGRITTPAGC